MGGVQEKGGGPLWSCRSGDGGALVSPRAAGWRGCREDPSPRGAAWQEVWLEESLDGQSPTPLASCGCLHWLNHPEAWGLLTGL